MNEWTMLISKYNRRLKVMEQTAHSTVSRSRLALPRPASHRDRQTHRQTWPVTTHTGTLRKLSSPIDSVIVLDFTRSCTPNRRSFRCIIGTPKYANVAVDRMPRTFFYWYARGQHQPWTFQRCKHHTAVSEEYFRQKLCKVCKLMTTAGAALASSFILSNYSVPIYLCMFVCNHAKS